MVVYLLEGVIFALIGLQLPTVLEGLGSSSVAALVLDAAVVSAAVIVARIVWVFPAAYLPRLLSRRIRAADPYPPWQHPAVIAWTGMRGVVSLAAALALPFTTAGGAPFPERASIQFLAFCVILATLVLQGLSLPAVIRWLGVGGRRGPDGREEATARHRTAEVALVVDDPDAPGGTYVHWVVTHLDPKQGGLPEGSLPAGAVQLRNSAGKAAWAGPCPPKGAAHHYRFTVYALSRRVEVAADAKPADTVAAIEQAATARGRLVGTFSR
jgi:Raf kinase inhibitor-like YbhB/YbcL family protein